jgi:hypothetical protein
MIYYFLVFLQYFSCDIYNISNSIHNNKKLIYYKNKVILYTIIYLKMFKIIKFNATNNNLYAVHSLFNHQLYNWYDLKNEPILQSHNFERTLVGKGSVEILDLGKLSSWTHKLKFKLNLPNEAIQFIEQNNILCGKDNIMYDYFSLLKYDTGDFFLNHRDTILTNVFDDSIHQYTCLIFCPYCEFNEMDEGGELLFKHPDKLYEIKFDPVVETKQNRFIMVIFFIDMYHEVLPIIRGSRWVFKKPLFVKTTTKKSKKDKIDELCDGCFDMHNGGGDY